MKRELASLRTKSVKTGEILHLINGVKRLEQKHSELQKLKSKSNKTKEDDTTASQ